MRTFLILIAGIAVGAFTVGSAIVLSPKLSGVFGRQANPHEHAKIPNDSPQQDDRVVLSDSQIETAGIKLAQARGGELQHHILVPGSIVPDADRIGRVAVRLLGTVSELRKGIGDAVEKGDIVAVIESREVAEAKSEFLGARLTSELQQTLATKVKSLWESRVTSENDYLRSRLAAQDAQIKFDAARQKLYALGLSETELAGLPDQPAESLRKLSLRSPIRGRVAERRVDVGGLVGREGQESELFVIVDLDKVWVDLAVSPNDIAKIRDAVEFTVRTAVTATEAKAKIVFISPLIDKETRNARVIAALENPAHTWQPGSFVTAEIPLGGEPAKVLVPKAAVQTLKGEPVVFVRQGDAFLPRKIKIGREDDNQFEVVAGLGAEETIAIANTFTLKAELGKSEAEHGH